MSVFSHRSGGYKAGVVLLLTGFVLLIIGFSSPDWTTTYMTYDYGGYHGTDMLDFGLNSIKEHNGLWVSCTENGYGQTHCGSFASLKPRWLSAVHALQCLSLIGVLASSFYAIVLNWMQVKPPHNRLVEIVSFLSGLLGAIGVIIYVVNTTDGLDMHMNSMYWHYGALTYVSWAAAMDLSGCVMIIFAAIILGVHNKPLQPQVSPSSTSAVGAAQTNNNGSNPTRSSASVTTHHRNYTSASSQPLPPTPQPAPAGASLQVPGPADVRVYYVPSQPAPVAITRFTNPAAVFNPPAYDATHYPPPPSSSAAAVPEHEIPHGHPPATSALPASTAHVKTKEATPMPPGM